VRLDNPLLADKRARQAMAMAIDRKTIVARLFDNRVDPAYSFKHPSQFGWDKSVKEFHYDPTAARALLAQAGFKPGPDGILLSPTGKRFSVDIVTTSGNRIRDLMEQVLQTEMKAIGIELVVHNQPARVMFGQTLRMRDFTGLVEFQSDQPLDYVPYYTLDSDWIPSAGNNWSGTNYMGLRDKAMDAALNEAWAALDPVARKAAWKRILDIYADEVPEIDLYFAASATITPKWLTGVVSTVRWGNPTNWIEDWKLR
jgi:peptide/nickel transport system substrate-binding protein